MRVVQKKVKFGGSVRDLYYEQFKSYQEYLSILESRTPHDSDETLEWLGKHDKHFTGVSSYDEARNLLVGGWEKQIEEFKKAFKKEVALCDTKKVIRNFADVVGYMPIVPNAILGLPNSMINVRTEQKKTKIVKFLIGMNRAWHVTPEEIMRTMSKVLAKICVLEKNGYRCRLEMFGSFTDEHSSKTIACHSILIKSENQLLDLKRVAFPLVHSAMQRVFGFGWEASVPTDNYRCGGKGTAMQYWSDKNRNALLNAVNESNEKIIYISSDTDVEKMFGEGGEIYGGK